MSIICPLIFIDFLFIANAHEAKMKILYQDNSHVSVVSGIVFELVILQKHMNIFPMPQINFLKNVYVF